MLRFKLSDGTQIDSVGFGTYKITDDLTGSKSVNIVKSALDAGYRYIDTAALYENEREVGEAVRASGLKREEVFIATKIPKNCLGYEKTKAATENSLSLLDNEYIDLMLIHWPVEFAGDTQWKEKLQGSYRALEEAVREGKIRALGLSNFLPHHIMALMETAQIKPVLNQLELHVGFMQQYACDYCRKNDIQLQAWSPLGRLRVFEHPLVKELAEKYSVNVSDILLRFLLQQGIAVIPKATSEAHILSNLNPAEFVISEEDMSRLLTLPETGWGGEHPDFEREKTDLRYMADC